MLEQRWNEDWKFWVDKDSFAFTSVQVTPVPKGVGILTTAFVIKNVVEAYKLQHS